ncbi:MAG TPA: HlyD family efflux transporter periplasmic adaptor subunit [Patescibacteria group bacterium]|nr:HlyD family efflux transporter periplasmic adaptor subunit [Patescibacteria group bacterium]
MKNVFSQLKNPKVLRILFIIGGVVLITAGILFFLKTTARVSIENSLVSAPVSTISPTTGGKLTEIDVFEGENVHKGDRLAVVGGETLFADTDGIVSMANNQLGSLTNQQTPIVQLIDGNNMRIAGTIDENKGLQDIRVGQTAAFTVDAIDGKTFWGYVDEISPSAKQTQLAFSISSERPTQQFVVYIKYNANAYPEIKNGMSAKITVYTATH